jgi:Ankyrin repeats (3 copies)
MNSLPPDNEDLPEVDALYRRLSAVAASQPGESVGAAVLAHAEQLAARARLAAQVPPHYSWQRPRRSWRRPTAFGALAAALLAVFMYPHFSTQPQPAPSAPLVVRAPADEPQAGSAPVFADISTARKSQAEAPAPVVAPAAPARLASRDTLQRPTQVSPTEATASTAATAATNALSAAAPAARQADSAARAEGAVSLSSERKASEALAAAPAASAAANTATVAKSREDTGVALWRAAESGDLGALRELAARHANLDVRDAAGRTAVMIATLHGHSQAVSVLLDAGANPDIADTSGESPLDAALAADESEIIAALKRHGAR